MNPDVKNQDRCIHPIFGETIDSLFSSFHIIFFGEIASFAHIDWILYERKHC